MTQLRKTHYVSVHIYVYINIPLLLHRGMGHVAYTWESVEKKEKAFSP